MAQLNPKITADVIEANEFPSLSQRYAVQAVPKTIVNDAVELIGAVPEGHVMQAIRKVFAAAEEETQP